jgi:outer membrane protein assembly factor BamB
METVQGFPVLTGLQLSSAPVAFLGKLYLCDEDGKVYTVDENGGQGIWETSFIAALRSPPSFLAVSSGKKGNNVYAAVYPKSFFGEIWLLDAEGKTLSNWPAPIAVENNDDESGGSLGIGFGSPLLFAHNNRVNIAFVNQSGQLLIYDEDAAFVQPFPIKLNGIFYQQPVFDGEFLWLVSSDGTFFRISLDGEVLYQNIPGFSVKEEGYITFFDSTGNKVPEIYITGEGNALYAFTRHFRSLEGFPLPVWGRPFFIPGQGNKKAEIFGMGMDRRLYRWQFK